VFCVGKKTRRSEDPKDLEIENGVGKGYAYYEAAKN